MKPHVLIIDSLSERYKLYCDAFAAKGLILEKASSMQDAIKKCSVKPFLFIMLNAESVDYYAQLQILRDSVCSPLHIFTENPTDDEELRVCNCGADLYTAWRDDSQKQALFCLAYSERHIQRQNEPVATIEFINYKSLRIYPDYRKAVIGDREVQLCRKEFDILHFLLSKRGKPFTYEQIYHKVWKGTYDSSCYDAVLSQVQRLRRKIYAEPSLVGCIETEREIGYRFLPVFD